MARWRWALLISELFLFALILILPQVDLPDTTFRDGGAPVVARLLVTVAPAMTASVGNTYRLVVRHWSDLQATALHPLDARASVDLRCFLCILLC
jgi:hypothetical protein